MATILQRCHQRILLRPEYFHLRSKGELSIKCPINKPVNVSRANLKTFGSNDLGGIPKKRGMQGGLRATLANPSNTLPNCKITFGLQFWTKQGNIIDPPNASDLQIFLQALPYFPSRPPYSQFFREPKANCIRARPWHQGSFSFNCH
jgi:hypothetical protein